MPFLKTVKNLQNRRSLIAGGFRALVIIFAQIFSKMTPPVIFMMASVLSEAS
jgi:hypothetical protein